MSASESEPIDAQIAAIQDVMLDANDHLKQGNLKQAYHKLDQAKRQTGVAMQETQR